MLKNEVPYGSDVSSGTYKCPNCGRTISVQSVTSLPPCACGGPKHYWIAKTGVGDAVNDPYP